MFDELLESIKEAVATEIEKEQFFTDRTNKHIALVQGAAQKIVDAHPELKELLQQVKNHDASKLEEPERTPYIDITWKFEHEHGKYNTPGMLPNEAENKATLHHIQTNSHHPEYHLKDKSQANISAVDRNKSVKCIDATAMPDIDIAEMVADWQAMSEELKNNTAREWFNKQKDIRWHFSEYQVELIDKLLKVFEEEKKNA